ncbi:hypothetical protein SCHPADRAFT_998163 [Schizopora paradoxa]|uniref:NACHT domain-containing protein n=1 Tax=Schizopora paradoxa TaxID=27342 RepID=A0A0H2RKD6_9AGAM|nr:hypothetical protein SCHPADRAFT_998163 [Schizopora paradoxa]
MARTTKRRTTDMARAGATGRSLKRRFLDIVLCKQSTLDSDLNDVAYRPRGNLKSPHAADRSGISVGARSTGDGSGAYDSNPAKRSIEFHEPSSSKIEDSQSCADGQSKEQTLRPGSQYPGPADGKDDSTSKVSYSHLIQTTDSLVTAVLEGLKDVGSNLPGIGAIAVVLSMKDKIQLEGSNRKEVDEILKYIEVLCRSADGTTGISDLPQMKPIKLSGDLIEHLKRASQDLEATKGRNRINRFINARAIEAELKAIWEGIQRHMNEFQFQASLKSDHVLDEVFKLILNEAEKEEEARINGIIDCMPVANLARHDAQRTKKSRVVSCSVGTRVNVIQEIQDWVMATERDDERHVFWLNGLAGTGKSTVAKSVAEWALQEKILGANFFFSRDIAELSKPSLVFPTISFELSRFDAQFKRALYDVLAEDSRIPFLNLEQQFEKLICAPFAACRGKRPILIMLDALDECAEDTDILLRLLLKYKAEGSEGPMLRIFITSRPEVGIRSELYQPAVKNQYDKLILHDIDASTVREDIRTYLDLEFSKMKSRLLSSHIPSDWPAQADRETLLDLCGRFFAYAATAIRFIGDEIVGDPVEQLRDILQIAGSAREASHLTPSENAKPYADLDALYLGVLTQSVSKTAAGRYAKRIKLVIMAVLCLRRPLSVSNLAHLLSLSTGDVLNALRNLHSVLVVPDEEDDLLRFFHASFPDFIQDPERCSDLRFYVDRKSNEVQSLEHTLALRCMAALGKVDFSYELPDLIRYGLRHWTSHLESGSPHETCTDMEPPGESLYSRPPQLRYAPYYLSQRRELEIQQIQDWLTRPDDTAPYVLWLGGKGSARLEKSDLAVTIANWVRKEGNFLSGCFVLGCDKEDIELQDPKCVFPALAAQLAVSDSRFSDELRKVLCGNPGVPSSTNLEEQFDRLIAKPLSACQSDRPFLAILASDGHSLTEGGEKILKVLLQQVGLGTGSFRVLVSCKAKAYYGKYIPTSVTSQRKSMTLNIASIQGRVDIECYLEETICELAKGVEIAGLTNNIPEGWPPREEFHRLVYVCGDSQWFAETALRFILDKRHQNPISRLQEFFQIEDIQPSNENDPSTVEHLNCEKFYLHILNQALTEFRFRKSTKSGIDEDHWQVTALFRQIVAVAIRMRRGKSSTIHDLSEFLSVDAEEILSALDPIQPLIYFNNSKISESPVVDCNPDFAGFIEGGRRCSDKRFAIDISAQSDFMALRCLKTMRNKVESKPPMRYADENWIYHIKGGTGLEHAMPQERKVLTYRPEHIPFAANVKLGTHN